jgi:hypothetical protein
MNEYKALFFSLEYKRVWINDDYTWFFDPLWTNEINYGYESCGFLFHCKLTNAEPGIDKLHVTWRWNVFLFGGINWCNIFIKL